MTTDPTEVFAGNSSINAEIHEILRSMPEPSCSRMCRNIRQAWAALKEQQTDEADAHARHAFREFLIGHQLNRNGFQLEYDKKLGEQTPDWYDEQNHLLLEVFTCERGGTSDLVKRVAGRIIEKVTKYSTAVEERQLSFVVAIHGDFIACVEPGDCQRAINDGGLFDHHPQLSGVIFFVECPQRLGGSNRRKQFYDFLYYANPNATRPIDLTEKLSYGDAIA